MVLAKPDRCTNILRLRPIPDNELVLGCGILWIVIIQAFVSRINRDLILLRRVVTGRGLYVSPFLSVTDLAGHVLRFVIMGRRKHRMSYQYRLRTRTRKILFRHWGVGGYLSRLDDRGAGHIEGRIETVASINAYGSHSQTLTRLGNWLLPQASGRGQ